MLLTIGVVIVIAPAIENVRHGQGGVPYRVTPFGYDLYPYAVLTTVASIPFILVVAWAIQRFTRLRGRQSSPPKSRPR